jgi:ferrous iron transport protein B
MVNNRESDILLVGQPNVGKSALFSRLTGVRTIVSNYPGTTVSYASGKMRFGGETHEVVDAPGTYSFEPLDEAARVTSELLDGAKRIINVVDATHLERHLPLTLDLLSRCAGRVAVTVALNMSDEAHHQGIIIDTARLEEHLGVPVVSIIARSGDGVSTLVERCRRQQADSQKSEHCVIQGSESLNEHDELWKEVGTIVSDVQTLSHHHHSFAERLEDITIHRVWGLLFALSVIVGSFVIIRMLGEFLIAGDIGIYGAPWINVPFGTELLFEKAFVPLLELLSSRLNADGFVHTLLIGNLIDGHIDLMQSFGVLTSGVFIPLGVVFPYLISFYLVLSILEDSGYLPRLAVFLDSIMHRIGLHGYAIIPTLLGLGCNVPGIMATRILEERRQRFVTATLISVAVPCAALQAMIIGLVGRNGIAPVVLVYGVLFIVWVIVSIVLRWISPGFRPELLIEIPPYRIPTFRALGSKLWMRMSGFLREALPIILGVIVVVNILYQFEVLEYIAGAAKPLVTRLWGMPSDAIVPLLVGILRKDIALGMLAPLDLTVKQLVIGSVMLAMFFPCIGSTVVLFRELGIVDALKSLAVMLIATTITGGILNLIL